MQEGFVTYSLCSSMCVVTLHKCLHVQMGSLELFTNYSYKCGIHIGMRGAVSSFMEEFVLQMAACTAK